MQPTPTLTPIFKGSIGLNTVDAPDRIVWNPENGVLALAAAENVVVDNGLSVRRRAGYERIATGSWHSLCSAGEYFLGMCDGDLCVITSELEVRVVRAGLNAEKVSYAQVNNRVYYTSLSGYGYVEDGVDCAWDFVEYVGPDTNRQFSGPFEAEHIMFFGGRLWLAKDNYVVMSEPFGLNQFDLHGRAFMVDSRIRMLKPVVSTAFVSSSSGIYSLQGNSPDDYKLELCYPHPVVEGTVAHDLMDSAVFEFQNYAGYCAVFATPVGVCVGVDAGFVMNLTEASIAYPECEEFGAGLLDGYNYVHTVGVR